MSLEKIIDFIHNLYGFIFCTQAIYYCIPLILTKTEFADESYFQNYIKLTKYSYYYFSFSTLLNIYEKNWLYIYHHLVCLIVLSYGMINMDYEYINWLGKNFLAEISTLFLTFGRIIYLLQKYGVKYTSKIIYYNNILFSLLFYTIRIFYLTPVNINYLIENKKNIIIDKYDYYSLVYILASTMIILNMYWAFYITKKLYKLLTKKND